MPSEPVPIGVYDHPCDPDVPFLECVNIGGGRIARFAKAVTDLTDEVADFLDSITPPP